MRLEALRCRVRGAIITAFDAGHAARCDSLVWNARKPARRAVIVVRAADLHDVQEAVRFAAANDLELSARGGGHQFTGIATQADMVVDLSALDGMSIDVAGRRAVVQPAVTNARLAAALDRHGLAFPVGHCGSVTVSGYLLGGGVGWNSGAWGIACHSVTAVDVVMADGSLLTASADAHPDVFWAARGAGPGFFGIVTAFHLALHEAPRALTSAIRVFPAAALDAVADWAEAAVARAPASLEFTAKVEATPDGPVIAAIANVFAMRESEARDVCADLGRDAPDCLALIGPMPTPFKALYESTGPSTPPGARYGVDCFWSDAGFGTVLARVVQAIGTAPSSQSFGLVALRSNARPVPDEAAFSISGRVFATLYGIWSEEAADGANLAWLRSTMSGCRGLATGRYVGEGDLNGPVALPTLSATASSRLADLAARHDPDGLFGGRRAVRSRTAA